MFVFMVAGSEGLQSATEQKFKYTTGSNCKTFYFCGFKFCFNSKHLALVWNGCAITLNSDISWGGGQTQREDFPEIFCCFSLTLNVN